MPILDQSAKSLYKSFSSAQLKELALAAKVSSEVVGRLRSREEVMKAVDGASSQNRLALLAHRIEALTPYKHCVLLESKEKFTYIQIAGACEQAFAGLFAGFSPLASDADGLHAQLCIADPASERVFIKFAHMVEVWEHTPSPDNQQLKTKTPRRHIIVAEISTSIQLVSVSFPGFTQAYVGKERVTYNSYAIEIASILEDKIGLKLEGFKLKAATDFLIEDKNEGVIDLRRTLRFKHGGKMDFDSESEEDAAATLAHGLANAGMTVSAEAIRTAFRSSEAQAIVLLWQKQGILTRMSMRHEFPEVLFIWNEADPSLTLINEVLQRLAMARAFVTSDGMKLARDYIASANGGELLRPSWLGQQFAIDQTQSIQLLLEAASAGLCQPRFRISAEERQISTPNQWVSSIAALPLTIQDDDGVLIETREPKNVEIAFERVAH